jgi:hypothetical protein
VDWGRNLVSWNNSGTTPAKNLILQLNATLGYQTPRIIPSSFLSENWHGKSRLFLWGTMLYSDIFADDPDRLSEFCVEISQVTVSRIAAQSIPPQPPKAVISNPNVGSQVTPKPADIGDLDAAIVGLTFQACNQHNCYDEECKDYKDRVKDMCP